VIDVTDVAWSNLSNQALTGAGILYFLAFLTQLWHWSLERPSGSLSAKLAMFARLAYLLMAFAAGLHVVALVARGLAADPNRVPWGNMYEFTISGVLALVGCYLVAVRRWQAEWLGAWVALLALALLMVAALALYQEAGPLTEALESPWLVIHVFAAILATGVFMVGGLTSALYLAKGSRAGRYLARVPDREALDRISYQLHAFGFPVWTFAALIAGPIWANRAWGSYWNWDAKEVWAFITWVIYAAYLHARATAGWRGKRAAILALVGVATLWFNFIGINYFSTNTQHSYARAQEFAASDQPRTETFGLEVSQHKG
jgi:cytochrome c-type biogenesis protein CcsB